MSVDYNKSQQVEGGSKGSPFISSIRKDNTKMLDSITTKLQEYLEQVSQGKAPPIDESIIEEFGERCKDTLRKFGTPQPFRIRMSNLGTGARKLYLDKRDTRETYNTEFLVKGTYGHIIEHFFMALLEACNITTGPKDKNVSLTLEDGTTINGSYDAKFKIKDYDGNESEYIFDFKTASEYSYTRKFRDLHSLELNDDFGYIDQAIGYSQADGTPFGGWFVINTAKGSFKIVDGRELNEPTRVSDSLDCYVTKIEEVNGDELPPPCNIPEPEIFNRKETGRYILANECSYCPHKFTCFPDVSYRPSLESKAQEKPYMWYVGLPETERV
jgi:hypothetical protein